MIAKISKGNGFLGALKYIYGKNAESIGGNMAGKTAKALADEFGVTRQLRADIEVPCYHVSLALPKEDGTLAAQDWEKISVKYLTRMGLNPQEHQYVVVRHTDKDYDHVHILTSRININGGVWKDYRDMIRSKNLCREIEAEHGLKAVSNVKNKKSQYRAKTTQRERRMMERTGKDTEKVYIQEKLNELLAGQSKLSPQKFCVELEERYNIIALPNVASTGKMNGFAFQYAGRNFTGSTVGYPWKHLNDYISIQPEDLAWMQARKDRLQQGTPADAVRSLRNALWETGIHGKSLDTALGKQGWILDGETLKKGTAEYPLSSIVDIDTFRSNLKILTSLDRKTKAKARARSRELVKTYHARPRKSFLAEMRAEDVLCGMALFPEVMVFLLLLSVVTEIVRQIDKPQNEDEFRGRMRNIWNEANADVQAEVKRIQQEMITNARITRSNPANQPKSQELGRGAGTEGADRGQGNEGVGTKVDRAAGGIATDTRIITGGGKELVLEEENSYRDDSDGIFGWGDTAPAGVEPARGQQPDVQVAPDSGAIGIEAIEEWASLAQDISVLARGDKDMSNAKGKEKSASVLYKEQVWDRQHSALQAPLYRVTARGRGDQDGKAVNLCKKNGTETFWSPEETKRQIPSLEYWNAKGYDIYLTPIDDKYHHILLDDLTAEGVAYIRGQYDVSLVQSSSNNNFQAIIRVPKAEISEEEQSAGNELLSALNHLPDGCGGDKSISATRHAFRMVGFHNKKPNKKNMQTKIEYLKPNTTCERATQELAAIRARRLQTAQQAKAQKEQADTVIRTKAIDNIGDITIARPAGETAADKDYRYRYHRILGFAKKQVREGIWSDIDNSAIDYRVAKEMLEDKYPERDIAMAMTRCSPNFYSRHGDDPDGYVRRTIHRAVQDIYKAQQAKETKGKKGPLFDGR